MGSGRKSGERQTRGPLGAICLCSYSPVLQLARVCVAKLCEMKNVILHCLAKNATSRIVYNSLKHSYECMPHLQKVGFRACLCAGTYFNYSLDSWTQVGVLAKYFHRSCMLYTLLLPYVWDLKMGDPQCAPNILWVGHLTLWIILPAMNRVQ